MSFGIPRISLTIEPIIVFERALKLAVNFLAMSLLSSFLKKSLTKNDILNTIIIKIVNITDLIIHKGNIKEKTVIILSEK